MRNSADDSGLNPEVLGMTRPDISGTYNISLVTHESVVNLSGSGLSG